MKLYFKQKLVSWNESYSIFDENGYVSYIVKGQESWGHKLNIYNVSGAYLGTIREEVEGLRFRYTIEVGKKLVGEIVKESADSETIRLNCCQNWNLGDEYLDGKYKIIDSQSNIVVNLSKQSNSIGSTYEIDVKVSEDGIYALLIVMASEISKLSA